MQRRSRPWIGACVILLGAGAAWAESKPPLVVFDLEAKGATALQAEAATQSVVRGLRELDVFQVLSAEDVRQLLAIERSRQLLGGGGSQLSDLGKAVGAKDAVVGSVTRVGDKLQVEIRLLDTAAGTVLSQKTLGPVAKMEDVAAALPGLSQELVGPLLREQQGGLLVTSSEPTSEVVVDGALVGSTPMKAPVEIPRGTHRLEVRKDGFIAQVRSVRIEPKQTATENFLLLPSADYAEAWKLRHGRLRIGAYLTTVGAVGAFVAAYAVGKGTVDTYNQEFVPRQFALNDKPLPQNLSTNPQLVQTWQDCGTHYAECQTRASSLQGQLGLQEAATFTLAALGVAAAGTATYLWLTGEDPNRYAKLVAGVSLTTTGPGFALTGSF